MSAEVSAPSHAEPARRVGRPRAFEDADVFAAIRAVLIRDGFHELTLMAVANELDVSTPALARRFGDKHEMLQAFMQATDTMVEKFCAELALRYESPLDSLRARWKIPIRNVPMEYDGKEGVLAWVEFLLCIRTDPSYGAQLEQRTRVWIDGVAKQLRAAYAAGEIVETDFDMLAHVLSSAMTGAMLFWFEHRRGDLYQEIGGIFEFILAPYKVAEKSLISSNGQRMAAGC
ncbi:hypothetical protein BH09CHL1_BH09CHL1_08560 [soil metagenome]